MKAWYLFFDQTLNRSENQFLEELTLFQSKKPQNKS
jgi:hypothetical protein